MSVFPDQMGFMSHDPNSTERKIPQKYAVPSDIGEKPFLVAAHAAAGGPQSAYVHLHDVAWHLSDYERPETGLSDAPDVDKLLLKRWADILAARGVIKHEKDTLYLIPRAEH